MRPYRIGISCGTRVAACSSSRATGSGRSARGVHRPWADRGASTRAARPRATRSSAVRCARRHVDANGGVLSPVVSARMSSAELGLTTMLTSGHAVSREGVPRPREPGRMIPGKTAAAGGSASGHFVGSLDEGMAAVAFVINGTLAKAGGRFLPLCHAAAARAGWTPEFRVTDKAEAGVTAAREAAADGADLVVAVGGDGTVRGCAEGLANTGIPLGIVPVGTGNLLAGTLRIPAHARAALAVALGARGAQGADRRIDL